MKNTILILYSNLKKKYFAIEYLCETTVWSTLKHKLLTLFILVIWLFLVILFSSHHELWRDEVRAFSLATNADNYVDLLHDLNNEGHPILWYCILRIMHAIIQTPISLKISAIVVSFVAVLLFYLKSPFKVWQKIFFLFGFFPLYRYTVFTRNYGISMLFMFLFAVFYSQKKKRPIILALIIVLLANTNAHSLILSGLFLMIWFFEDKLYKIGKLSNKTILLYTLAFFIVGLGISFSAFTILPDESSTVPGFRQTQIELSSFIREGLISLVYPGRSFNTVFLIPILRIMLPFVFVLGLIIKPLRALALYLGLIIFSLFFLFVYSGFSRHQGLIFIFIVSLYWITSRDVNENFNPKKFKIKLFYVVNYVFLSLLFLLHIYTGLKSIYYDWTKPMSSSVNLADFIKNNQQYKNAIIMAEPDFFIESLPYYILNRTYIPREESFNEYVSFTNQSKQDYSLSELLAAAKTINAQENEKVLILLSHEIVDSSKTSFNHSYGKTFSWNESSLKEFLYATKKVADFNNAFGDEEYLVYELN